MKRIAVALAATSLAAAGVAPAIAASAPPVSNFTTASGAVYGTEMYYDGGTWIPGTLAGSNINVDIYQTGSPNIRVVSVHVGNGINLTGVNGTYVYGIDGDDCANGSIVSSVSGDEVSIKGFNCWDDDGDGRTEVAVDIDGFTGTIMSSYFTGHQIDGQFRYYDNRRNKSGSYRYASPTGLDFYSND